MKNLLIGNGINIQYGGYSYSNGAIILRTLKNLSDCNFPKHIVCNEPILLKIYFAQLFNEAKMMIDGEYDIYTNSSVEKKSLDEFKKKYKSMGSLKISDIGFEDYYLIHDLFCHKNKIKNPEMFDIRNGLSLSFLFSIYDDGRVSELYKKYTSEFIKWLNGFDNIYTTNYDKNIDNVVNCDVYHLHGDFYTMDELYLENSFRNLLPDSPIKDKIVDKNYSYLYSTAISTHSGDYKELMLKQKQLANDGFEKFAIGYVENKDIKNDIDSWENDNNKLVRNMYHAIKLKVEDPQISFKQQYPLNEFKDMSGELVILGLSPYNDNHIFEIIDNSAVTNCTFYYYDEVECEIIKKMLPSKEITCKSVVEFWNDYNNKYEHYKPQKEVIENKKSKIKRINKNSFKINCNLARILTGSIMSDGEILNNINKLNLKTKFEIKNRIKEIKYSTELTSQENELRTIVDFHIISEEYKVDPAILFFCGQDEADMFIKIV